ncbi:MAG TPA: G1 family glutamic endopeptidase [Candidatus Dormibacteraeota bacterium]|nr:G1 family glutamic endopeptidase [Candidatus Dormibacteraeota bacterium]
MVKPRSRVQRLAMGCAGALVGGGLALGTVAASADTGPLGGPTPITRNESKIVAHSMVGAESRLSASTLIRSGSQSEPTLPTNPSGAENSSAQSSAAVANGAYTALPPTRVLDTRLSGSALGPNGSRDLTVTGGSVPGDSTAVALNVTVTDGTADSFLSVYPAGTARPLVSSLNWAAGETLANLVIVPTGAGGQVTIYNDLGTTDVVADLEGYFAPEPSGSTAGSYVPLTPARIADTRTASSEPYSGHTLHAGETLDIQVTGAGAVPTSGVAAALLNVTATDTTSASFLTVFPAGESLPVASNLNWGPGATVPGRVVVPVSSTGQISAYNNLGSTDLVVDVDGYFTDGTATPAAASLFSAISPVRVLDTRTTAQTLGTGSVLVQTAAGLDGIPTNATAVVTNVTATNTTAASYFTVYPGGTRPLASDLNWGVGQTVANLTVAGLSSSSGAISVYNSAGSSDLIIDVFGYFVPESPTPVVITTDTLPTATVGSAYSTAMSAYGGTPPYFWTISVGALPAGLSLSTGGVISGTPTAASTFTFTVQVTDSSTPTAETAAAPLSILVYLASPTQIDSANWSGYILGDGPYTAVSGTFNVPDLVATATATATYASEWAGIDGFSNSDLIQAGVDEMYDPSTNLVYLEAWWEILPAAETPITTLDVAPGDSISVAISQFSSSVWSIEVSDNTTGNTFATHQAYTGPLSSAEWIVEAPEVNGVIANLGEYSPDVKFSGLGVVGSQTSQNSLTKAALVQDGRQVSTPSSWTTSGFTVAYGDLAPPPPQT